MRKLELFSSPGYSKQLGFGSPTKMIAARRSAVYEGVMNNMEAMKDRARQLGLFSSSAEMQSSVLGTSLKEASIQAYLDSFAGYIAVESTLDQMTQLLTYKDMITKGTGAVVMPNLGKQDPRGLAQTTTKSTIPVGNKTGTVDFGLPVVPRSISIIAVVDGKTTEIKDDGKGGLLALGGVLQSGSIDYSTGQLKYELIPTPVAGDEFRIQYATDALTEAHSSKRIKARQGHYVITAKPNVFDYEMNLVASAINSKAVGTDDLEVMKKAVTDEHQMSINDQLVRSIKDNYAGTTLTQDLSMFSVQAGKFSSLIRTFQSGLTSIDSALAMKCYKVVKATAYIVGLGMADIFGSMNENEHWVPNNTGYVNGLIGFYKGRAVLTHMYLDAFEGFAVHKTESGELAPTALGIYLPATDLPIVGNFNNISEIAGGIYSVEGTSFLTSDLVQRFVLTMPSDWMVMS